MYCKSTYFRITFVIVPYSVDVVILSKVFCKKVKFHTISPNAYGQQI